MSKSKSATEAQAERMMFSDDQPKENPWQHDLLGYKPFAEAMFKAVRGLSAPNGYVIGLNGAWGAGKSTAVNFIKAFIEKHNQEVEKDSDRIVVIDYRPWLVSGHRDLVAAFFKVLSESLGPNETKLKAATKTAARAGARAIDPIVESAAKLGQLLEAYGVPSGAVSASARLVGNAAKKAMEDYVAEPSLQKAHDELRERMKGEKRKIIVIIDDLDRLPDEEIRDILRMVKAIGRLPNVVYLLVYDRKVLAGAVGELREADGQPTFLEKIIQHEVELAIADRFDLLSIIDREVPDPLSHVRDDMRWHILRSEGLFRWIQTPRDVVRLTNGIKFAWAALGKEVDPPDVIVMEGLKLFEPNLFDWVRKNRDFLFSDGAYKFDAKKAYSIKKAEIEGLVADERRVSALRLMSTLFPHRKECFDKESVFGGEFSSSVIARRGIGSQDGYDAYFKLHPASQSIAKSRIDALLDPVQDVTFITSAFEEALETTSRGVPLIGKLITELRARLDVHGAPFPSSNLFHALLAVGDRILALQTRDWFFGQPQWQWRALIDTILHKWVPTRLTRSCWSALKAPRLAQPAPSTLIGDASLGLSRQIGGTPL